jgi:hypothetical protein
MLGSLGGCEVGGGEQGVLLVPAWEGSGLWWSAAIGATGLGLGRGAAGQAVLEELLVLGPPLLAEQRLSPLRRVTARHGFVFPRWWADSWMRFAVASVSLMTSDLNQIIEFVN